MFGRDFDTGSVASGPARSNTLGMTLIELMVVVAIVGILAAIGGVAYTKYLKQGKISRLKQYAMEVKQGQEQFKARNGTYYEPDGPYYNDGNSGGSVNEQWEDYLGFSHPSIQNTTIEVRTEFGNGGGCGICSDPGITPEDTSGLWYAVVVEQQLTPGGDPTYVYTDSSRDMTVLVNEGE